MACTALVGPDPCLIPLCPLEVILALVLNAFAPHSLQKSRHETVYLAVLLHNVGAQRGNTAPGVPLMQAAWDSALCSCAHYGTVISN
jgi:hypothetical protein